MNISIGNTILIIGITIGAGILIWQFIKVNQFNDTSDDEIYYDEVDTLEDSIEETEEFMRRMERLSKREDDNKKK